VLGGGGWLTPRPGHFTPKKDPVPIVQEAAWAPGPVWTCAKNLAPTGIRSLDRPAHSQLLYWLSYSGPFLKWYIWKFCIIFLLHWHRCFVYFSVIQYKICIKLLIFTCCKCHSFEYKTGQSVLCCLLIIIIYAHKSIRTSFFIIFSGSAAQHRLWPLHPRGFVITHNDMPQSVGLFWMSDHLVAETSTWQHTTHTTDKHPYPRWDLNPRSQ
jgi:hypothetical protein